MKTIDEVIQNIPEIEKAHTYASENADIYRAYDKGQKDYKIRIEKYIKQELNAMLDEILGQKIEYQNPNDFQKVYSIGYNNKWEEISKKINEMRGEK